jgi:glycine dehydrogenase subunit 1
MTYIPHTSDEIKEMLDVIGVSSIDDLFSSLPQETLLKKDLNLPNAHSEIEVSASLKKLSQQNYSDEFTFFLGAGAYNHWIPAAIKHIVSRSEFYTAYTPYQGEASQGTLQSIFEYQSLICELTGMDVANASLYDGSHSIVEAVNLAVSFTGQKKVLAARTLNPFYRQVMKTYGKANSWQIFEVPFDNGIINVKFLKENLRIFENAACIVIQQPNFFGCLEEVHQIREIINNKNLLLIAAVDPISLGILQSPSEYGADVVVAEGQSIGLPLNFGGPYLGIFACREKYLHYMPGRIVGETKDKNGRRAFVLTLQTREQHIRRQRATSNICSNEALCALAACVYLSLLGPEGIKNVARQSLENAHFLAEKISKLPGFSIKFTAPYFKEFVCQMSIPPAELNKKLLEHKIIGGLDLTPYYSDLKNCMLLTVTEMINKEEIDRFIGILKNSVERRA